MFVYLLTPGEWKRNNAPHYTIQGSSLTHVNFFQRHTNPPIQKLVFSFPKMSKAFEMRIFWEALEWMGRRKRQYVRVWARDNKQVKHKSTWRAKIKQTNLQYISDKSTICIWNVSVCILWDNKFNNNVLVCQNKTDKSHYISISLYLILALNVSNKSNTGAIHKTCKHIAI